MTDFEVKRKTFQHQQARRAREGSIVTRRQLVAAAQLVLRAHGDPGLTFVADLMVGALRGEPLGLSARSEGLPGYDHRGIAAAHALLINRGVSSPDAKATTAAVMGCSSRSVERALRRYPGTRKLSDDVLDLMVGDEARQRLAKLCR